VLAFFDPLGLALVDTPGAHDLGAAFPHEPTEHDHAVLEDVRHSKRPVLIVHGAVDLAEAEPPA
jgi:hypothetical protein